MAGNLVKWWKHKILGGYKQFSVQECTTDSEELMYHQVRASSSCSAPPDLLLVSDRENNIPLRSPVVNIITTTTAAHQHTPSVSTASTAATSAGTPAATGNANASAAAAGNGTLQQKPHGATKNGGGKHLRMSGSTKKHETPAGNGMLMVNGDDPLQQQQQQSHHGQQHGAYTRHSSQQQQQQPQQQPNHAKEEHIRLEEFTCDVSVEGGKSSQPLQFSFTFYDLDGHHGKITKDDIVGIVYTIYESIGKSVVVPHCGSKTINVRLTVSPEGKSAAKAAAAAAKLKKLPGGGAGTGDVKAHHHHHHHHNNDAIQMMAVATAAAATSSGNGHARRQHRYRPRKLIKSDDEDDDSNSEKEGKENVTAAAGNATAGATAAAAPTTTDKSRSSHAANGGKYGKYRAADCCRQDAGDCGTQPQPDSGLYANMTANLKCCSGSAKDTCVVEECRSCSHQTSSATATSAAAAAATPSQNAPAATEAIHLVGGGHHHSHHHNRSSLSNDVYMKQASTRVKMLRKARKQKYQDHCIETRQRSLSVGNESCWKNRHLTNAPFKAVAPHHAHSPAPHQTASPADGCDMVDGVQLRKPLRNPNVAAATAAASLVTSPAAATTSPAQKRNSAECWKTALNRNDLISIIRESMEKNRLCFQLNGKPQANVSPIRHSQQAPAASQSHRQRSNTVSKIPTLIANHSSTTNTTTNTSSNNITSTLSPQHNSSSAHTATVGASAALSPAMVSPATIISSTPTHTTTSNNTHPQQQPSLLPNSNSNNNISNNNITTPTHTHTTNNTHHQHNHHHNHHLNQQQHTSSQHSNSSSGHSLNNNNNNHIADPSHNDTINTQHSHSHSNNSLYHPQPHIPIYHQQMAINPAVLAAAQTAMLGGHNGHKLNLCGYDSFLHATICGGGGGAHSPPHPPAAHPTSAAAAISLQPLASNHPQVAHVQPLITVPNKVAAAATTTTTAKHASPKFIANGATASSMSQHIKQSKILRSGSYAQQQQQQLHLPSEASHPNSPQYHGYQRLSRDKSPPIADSASPMEKWLHGCRETAALRARSGQQQQQQIALRKDSPRNYENLIYAKLSERLQETTLQQRNSLNHLNNNNTNTTNNKENHQQQQQRRRLTSHHHKSSATASSSAKRLHQGSSRSHHPRGASTNAATSLAAVVELATKLGEKTSNTYSHLIPMHGDPLECENLLGQTTDDEEGSAAAAAASGGVANQAIVSDNLMQGETTTTTGSLEASTKTSPKDSLKGEESTPVVGQAGGADVATATLVNLNDEEDEAAPQQQQHQGQQHQVQPHPVQQQPQLVQPPIAASATEEDLLEALSLRHHDDDLIEVDDEDDDEEEEVDVDVDDEDVEEEDEEDDEEDLIETESGGGGGGGAMVNTSASSSSLIHRYVHEHIHHHYHHFEEKDE